MKPTLMAWSNLVFIASLAAEAADFSTARDSDFTERVKRQLIWTYNSAIGMFLAFAVPVDIPDRDVLFSWNIEANYNLPTNLSIYDLSYPERSFSGINRSSTYSLIERRLDNLGMNGRQCLLRLICDIARTPISHNGLVGKLLEIIFLPSKSIEEEGLDDAIEAEKIGSEEPTECGQLFYKCPQSLIDVFSYVRG
ncbi:DM4/DM12 family [Nesidiocoris tenuis]|uniref:DM4/DM12 family n=1 Tax=Nesidiocoris tenuis TaxID=355587 RepID=A0ABN7AMW8_9HEMI|nr:DM4/DM12 family [Nesidiocoris tenuis]